MEIVRTAGQNGISITPDQLAVLNVKPGQKVSVSKWHPSLNAKQRGIWFGGYLPYCIEHGLKEMGHFSVDGLYLDVKAWIKENHPLDFPKVGLSQMNTIEFESYWKIIDLEYFQILAGVDTSGFWKDYEDFKASGTEESFTEWKAGL